MAASVMMAIRSTKPLSTKVPILLGRGYWIFAAPSGWSAGSWDMAHESRTDLAMLLGSLFLAAVGAGQRSLDAWLAVRRR